jgi:hypothetical protein
MAVLIPGPPVGGAVGVMIGVTAAAALLSPRLL